jgi:site-specific recombinase XerD
VSVPGRSGGRLEPGLARSELRRDQSRAALDPVGIARAQRHATLLLEDGFDAKYVSERLGHDSVQTTLKLYGHVTSKRRRHAAKRIGSMLDEAPGNSDSQPDSDEEP